MTLNDKEVQGVLKAGAKTALREWFNGKFQEQEQALADLVNDLWVWYLESPSVQAKVQESDLKLARTVVARKALQQLAGDALQSDLFQGKSLYSTDAIKDGLKNMSTNKYLKAILPLAMESVQHRDDQTPGRGYAEAIRSRYDDGEVPSRGTPQVRLTRAVKSLTDEVNVMYLTTEDEGAGSSNAVFPGLRKAKGGHSDPTGNTALLLMDDAELRANYLEETPWDELIHGAATQPVYPVNEKGTQIRVTGGPAQILLQQPELVDLYTSLAREELEL